MTSRLIPVTHVAGDRVPRCAVCKAYDPLGGLAEDDETGAVWWECRVCRGDFDLPPELPGQTEMDLGDAGALVGELMD